MRVVEVLYITCKPKAGADRLHPPRSKQRPPAAENVPHPFCERRREEGSGSSLQVVEGPRPCNRPCTTGAVGCTTWRTRLQQHQAWVQVPLRLAKKERRASHARLCTPTHGPLCYQGGSAAAAERFQNCVLELRGSHHSKLPPPIKHSRHE